MAKQKENLEVKCEACGTEGSIRIGEMESVNCPSCGARYIAWRPPGSPTLKLKCVVRPVMEGEWQ